MPTLFKYIFKYEYNIKGCKCSKIFESNFKFKKFYSQFYVQY
ncbi:hypothetical protein CSCA_5171 [Clostridium scatologenes]|uniref:Uncharacterized protein n=1 Tax=Clostridium scatologenes TaxID=1548 RepID=A0A0E3GSL8_CLOSL|nr:hypothetical protein CSCA_5171 [Clostridium scatologenes]